ncbi:S8 family serine peptidase [Streptomyces sp. M10(2022)]
MDSGVDSTNPDLDGRVLKGLNLERDVPGNELKDYSGHGTGMAGIIAGTGQAQGEWGFRAGTRGEDSSCADA